jgi:hypothetical protein
LRAADQTTILPAESDSPRSKVRVRVQGPDASLGGSPEGSAEGEAARQASDPRPRNWPAWKIREGHKAMWADLYQGQVAGADSLLGPGQQKPFTHEADTRARA